jgi:ABC-type bacteriocin/lantibiotic exporter with double-glycine peptidase domain
VIEGVPFIPQKRNWCGPACLAMVARYYGVGISQEKLAGEIYQRRLRGAVNLDLLLAARRLGFQAHASEGDLDKLKALLRKNRPVIALVETIRAGVFHYLLVYGYDDDKEVVIVHSGRDSAREIGYRDFSFSWEASRNWMLVVEQKEE